MEYEIPATMPRLVIESPTCSHCGEPVQMDGDAAWCEGCRVSWDRIEDGLLAVPDPELEGTDVPCGVTLPPIDSGAGWTLVQGPCILPSGHESDHERPMSRVTNEPTNTEGGAT